MHFDPIQTAAFESLRSVTRVEFRFFEAVRRGTAGAFGRVVRACKNFRRSLSVTRAEMDLLSFPEHLPDDIGPARNDLHCWFAESPAARKADKQHSAG